MREVLEMSILGQSMSGVSAGTFFGLENAGLIRINTGFGGGFGPTELCKLFVELALYFQIRSMAALAGCGRNKRSVHDPKRT